jgi:hypothetical protein
MGLPDDVPFDAALPSSQVIVHQKCFLVFMSSLFCSWRSNNQWPTYLGRLLMGFTVATRRLFTRSLVLAHSDAEHATAPIFPCAFCLPTLYRDLIQNDSPCAVEELPVPHRKRAATTNSDFGVKGGGKQVPDTLSPTHSIFTDELIAKLALAYEKLYYV